MNQYGTYTEFLLSPSEKETFSKWKEARCDKSLINRLLRPLFRHLSIYVPENVAPNLLTMLGLVSILQAWYFCVMFHKSAPQLVSAVSVLGISVYWVLHGVDGWHAYNTKNDTSVGELFKYVVDNIACIFIPTIIFYVFGASENIEIQWYAVQTGQLVLMYKHHSAFLRETGMRYWFFGPGEVITFVINILILHAIFGMGVFVGWYSHAYGVLRATISEVLPNVPARLPTDLMALNTSLMQSVYFLAFCTLVFRLLRRLGSPKHSFTRWGLMLVVHCRLVPAVLHFSDIDILSLHQLKATQMDVILDGLFMSVVTSDIIVAKMANRELHSWVIFMAVCVILPQLEMVMILFVSFYYVCIFVDICWFMNLPLLSRCQNVYCDGVYDLCHIGHKNLFKAALKNGNRLFVGVMSDEDCKNYKRAPIMSHDERCAEVEACKHVTKVIRDAPCFGLTEEFLHHHRIHVVCCGVEYIERYPNPDDDPYYGVPRKLGIVSPLPRTEGLSTSDLIRRVQASVPDGEKKSPT
eukprot:GEMP01030144.1.p1 GENE.GEMP01030144.1~~GEMP01030144.1.p1  ORF type:complete len:523 (+),score=67.69 GEMP01030144.1:135-1703(+)